MEEEGGRRVWDLMSGFRASMPSLWWRKESTSALVMCKGRREDVVTVVVVFSIEDMIADF